MRPVTERDVRDLVRDHARDLAFIPRVLDDAAVEVDVAARKCERVDVRCVHDPEAVLELRAARVRRELLSDAIDVVLHARIAQDGELAFGLNGGLLADLHVLLRAEHVPPGIDLGLGLGHTRPEGQREHEREHRTREMR